MADSYKIRMYKRRAWQFRFQILGAWIGLLTLVILVFT